MLDALGEHDVPYGDDWDNAGFNRPVSSADSRLPRALTRATRLGGQELFL